MIIKCETKDRLPLKDLTEFQGNLKHRTEGDYKKIITSIRKYGFSFPFFVWRHDGTNYVLDGHGRLGALQRMRAAGDQIPDLPVVYVDCPDEEAAKNLLLRLNSQYGTMTTESVLDFMAGIDFDPAELALPDGVLEIKLGDDHPEDDDAPEVEPDEPAESQPGEIYRLGQHILLCGDATKAEDVEKLMAGTKADLVVTDPPYNVNLGQGGSSMSKESRLRRSGGGFIINDHMDDNAFYNFLLAIYANIKKFTKAGGAFYVWHADAEGLNFRKALKNAGLELRQNLIWVKNSLVLGRQDYQWRHEPCLYGWNDGGSHFWEGRRDLTTVIDDRPDYKKMDKAQLLAEIEKLRGDRIPSTVIYEDRPTRSKDHPTMKPVKLFMRLIRNSSKAEDTVLDLFGGSGTTIIACQRTNRLARVMELDPHYCDVIRRRWTKWAGENGIDPGPGALE